MNFLRKLSEHRFMMSEIHIKCRAPYEYTYRDPDGQIKKFKRQDVPAGKISWDIPDNTYDPISFDALHLGVYICSKIFLRYEMDRMTYLNVRKRILLLKFS